MTSKTVHLGSLASTVAALAISLGVSNADAQPAGAAAPSGAQPQGAPTTPVSKQIKYKDNISPASSQSKIIPAGKVTAPSSTQLPAVQKTQLPSEQH